MEAITEEIKVFLEQDYVRKFVVDPLDVHVAGMQMDLEKALKAYAKGKRKFKPIVLRHESRDQTLCIGLVELSCRESATDTEMLDFVVSVWDKEHKRCHEYCFAKVNKSDAYDYVLRSRDVFTTVKGLSLWVSELNSKDEK